MKSFRFKIKFAELIQSIRRSAICSRLLAKVLALATVVFVNEVIQKILVYGSNEPVIVSMNVPPWMLDN